MAHGCLLLILAAILATTAEAGDTSPAPVSGWEKYGVTHEPTQQEIEEDQKYGGFPNNKLFNNDTKCSEVVKLFDTPQMGPSNPKMMAFLLYTRVKLAETDIFETTINNSPSVFERLGRGWAALPALYASYCRRNPTDTLDNATFAIYKAAQRSAQ
jgi:hypothetical protein